MRDMMGKAWMRLLSRAALCVATVALTVLIGALMVSAEVYSGECGAQGDNVVWTLDTETGVLLIEGQGSTEGYSQYVNPTWFPYRDSVKEVKLSSGITCVGHWLFYGCKKLERADLPDSVTRIGFTAFSGCSSLREVNVPEGVKTIESSTFYGCASLETIHIPDGVTAIRSSAFANCRNLRAIRIPDSVTSIEIHAFSGCNNLREVIMSKNLTVMGDYVFSACYGLTEMALPSTLRSIGHRAFMACDGLTDVYYDGSLAQWKSVSVGRENECLLNATLHLNETESQGLVFTSYGNGTCYISGKGTFNDSVLVIPAVSPAGDRVTRIKNETFANCAWLTSVTVPEGVTSLGREAFKNCGNLTSVSLPDSLETVDADVFAGCVNLWKIEGCVKYVDRWAVGYTNGITEAVLREDTVGIADASFAGCAGLVRLSIPENVKHIGDYAFSNCTALESIRYNARDLGNGFSDYNYVFYRAGRSGKGIEVVIGARVKAIPAHLFAPDRSYALDYATYAPKVIRVVFEEGSVCETISYCAFEGCVYLQSIQIPDSVTSIGGSAFRGCIGLTYLHIPEGVKTLDGSAFSGCANLTDLRIPSTVTHIFNATSMNHGGMMQNVNGIHYVDTWIVGKDKGITHAVIRPGTVGIGDSAFEENCEGLVSLVIPASLAHMGEWALYDHDWRIADVYYMGTEAEWQKIDRGFFQLSLEGATVHFLGDLYDITAASLTLGDSLTMNYYAKADPSFGTPKMRFTYRGETVVETGALNETSGEYVFSLKGIAPQCMGETIKAELVLVWEDGTEFAVDVKEAYSVRAYCDDALAADPDNKALATLLADLLAYGAAAQDYTDFKADTPVGEGFGAAPSEWEDVTDTDFSLSDKTREDIRFTAAGVRFGYVNYIYFKIKAADLAGVTLTVNGKTYTAHDLAPTEDDDDTYILYTDPIRATELDKVFTAELAADGEVIQTLIYSVKSYVYAKQNAENNKMAALVKALYSYGCSAVAYKSTQ